MKKIVVASDSFKGSLSSVDVALSAEKGVKEVFPACDVVKINVADGGEGTVDAVVEALNGKKVEILLLSRWRRQADCRCSHLNNATHGKHQPMALER